MIEVTLIEANGSAHVVQVPPDQTLLDVVLAHKVPGIPGDCGGACACSSCHVIVEAAWIEACAVYWALAVAFLRPDQGPAIAL